LAAATVRSATSIVGDTDQENIKHTPDGNAAVLAGSCSDRTLHQIDVLVDAGHPTFYLDPTDEPEPVRLAATALRWFDKANSVHGGLAPGFYSSARQDELERVQKSCFRSAFTRSDERGRNIGSPHLPDLLITAASSCRLMPKGGPSHAICQGFLAEARERTLRRPRLPPALLTARGEVPESNHCSPRVAGRRWRAETRSQCGAS
jgi:hypothetical protein